jgi:hypothetical protein
VANKHKANEDTLWDHTLPLVRALVTDAGMPGRTADALELFQVLSASWGGRRLGETPRWSGLTDDCTPVQPSLIVSPDGAEAELLVEPQDEPATARSYWAAGERAIDELERRGLTDASAFRSVKDLFRPVPQDNVVYFSLWLAARVRPRGSGIAVYLNPAAAGKDPIAVCRTASARLGARRAWTEVEKALAPGDRVLALGFDLGPARTRQLHLFVRPPGGSVEPLERLCQVGGSATRGEIAEFWERALGPAAQHIGRPALVSLHLDGDGGHRRATARLPLCPHASDNAENRRRFGRLLQHYRLPTRGYEAFARAVCTSARKRRSLLGAHSWITREEESGAVRVAFSFNPSTYMGGYGALSLEPGYPWPSPLTPQPEGAAR